MVNISGTVQPITPTDIDVEEVLREYGLDSIAESSTVIQQNNNIINVPNDMLEPPTLNNSVTTLPPDANVEETLDAITSEANTDEIVDIVTVDLRADANIGTDVALNTEDSLVTNVVEAQSGEEEHSDEEQLLDPELAVDLLPLNSKSLDFDESTSRFSGAEWYNAIQESKVILAGLGGIGRFQEILTLNFRLLQSKLVTLYYY